MGEKEKVEGMLSPYRALDLTDEKGLLCGKLLGDLGADVIKIERPGGNPARGIGPFCHDEADPEKSLFWLALNTSKRGITLDIETATGQEILKKLVKSADWVIESFPPGYMDKIGLGYSVLEKVNPGVILVSITPFGQTGPYKDYKAPDIVAWAMGGMMYPCGDPDRPPVRISHHSQAHLHAGAEAAVGAMIALQWREMTGEGQRVDVSIQESVIQATYLPTTSWEAMKVVHYRGGHRPGTDIRVTRVWPCKDGYVMFYFTGGPVGMHINIPLVKWLEIEGAADDFLKGFDWSTFDMTTTTQEIVDRLEEPTGRFFRSHTKAELQEGALKHRVILYPVSTTEDILENTQLTARDFWVEVEHPELGTTITYPGAFTHTSAIPPRITRRAPLIGEHNQEIYEEELGISGGGLLPSGENKNYSVRLNKKNKSERPEKKPFAGIRVIDFGWNITIPLTAKMLTFYGAEVIRIEGKSRPDPIRLAVPFKDGVPGLNRSGGVNQYNTGKLSLALNLTHPKGVELVKRLVARSDIVLENFAGGVMAKMGLGYEELKQVKPDTIMLSSCMMGQTGPYATHPGYGWHLTALSGFFQLTGWPDREPVPPDGPYTDFIAPHFNLLAILAALDYRRRTGKGQYLDLSQYENGVHFLAPLILDYAVNRRVAERMGNRSDKAAPHGAYRCRGEDRWCAIAIFTDEEWGSFSRVIGNLAWANDLRFATLAGRKQNEDELERLVEEWTVNYSAEEVMNQLQRAGVAAGVLENGEDLLERDPQLKHRRSFGELDHPEVGKYRTPRPSFILSKCPGELERAPLIGEHNEYVLKEILGITDEEIAELIIAGVVE